MIASLVEALQQLHASTQNCEELFIIVYRLKGDVDSQLMAQASSWPGSISVRIHSFVVGSCAVIMALC